jgi:hypothetical protein
MKLYETYNELETVWIQIENLLDGCHDFFDTGEKVDEEEELAKLETALKAIEDQREEKAIRIACMIKNMKADAVALKQEKDRLAKREKLTERGIERLKGYLSDFIEPGTKIKDPRASISWRASDSDSFLLALVLDCLECGF